MAESNVVIRVKAYDDASPTLKKVAGNLKGLDGAAANSARGVTTLGRGFLYAAGQAGPLNSELGVLSSASTSVGLGAAGAAIGIGLLALGLTKTVTAAVAFESGITRVAKTANLSATETKRFGDAILEMSRRLPVATSDLLNIAVVAGQLGINGAPNIARFTEEVAKLASTTGVSADLLATSLGTLAQVSGLPIKDIGRLSAVITELGNTSNSTESQILDFSVRLVGIASALNVPIAAVAGISSAFAAAGVDSEAGATAIQRLMIGISEAAQKGGDELQLFANVTGKTADEFRALVNSNPAEAFTQFIEGLRGVPNAIQVLDALGLADARLIRAVESVANSQEPLRKSIETANRAALEGTATNKEFGRSAETTAAKFQVLKNNIAATSIEIGDTFNPAVAGALDGINGLFANADISGGIANFRSNLAEFGKSLDGVTDKAKQLNSALGDLPGPGPVDVLAKAFDNLGSAILRAAENLPGIGSTITGIAAGIAGIKALTTDHGKSADTSAADVLKDPRFTNLALDLQEMDLANRIAFPATEPKKQSIAIPKGLSDGGAAKEILTLAKALEDLTITAREAAELGLSPADAALAELAAEAGGQLTEEAFRAQVELHKLATLFPGLTGAQVQFRLGLAAIAQNLRDTNRTAEEFDLAERLRPALEGVRAQFDAIFNRPSRETAGLQLRQDELERKKLLLVRGGAAATDPRAKALDAQIAGIQQEIAIRQKDIDIAKDRAILADQTLQTDQALATQAALLTTAIGITSGQVTEVGGIVFLQMTNLGNAANEAAAALRGIGGVPSYASGTDYVPRTGLALLHKGEQVLSAGQQSGAQPINITTYITADSEASDAAMRRLAVMVREEIDGRLRLGGFSAGAVNQNAFTPGGRR